MHKDVGAIHESPAKSLSLWERWIAKQDGEGCRDRRLSQRIAKCGRGWRPRQPEKKPSPVGEGVVRVLTSMTDEVFALSLSRLPLKGTVNRYCAKGNSYPGIHLR